MSEVALLKPAYCYLSTPEHLRRFVGQWIYIYTDQGELSLSGTHLRFVGKSGIPMSISLDSIIDISVSHHPRSAKPIRLDYISVRHRDRGLERTTLLTPTLSWMTPTWETNEIVADWADALQSAQSRCVEPSPAFGVG